MPHYISLCKWTSQGITNVKQSPERLEKAKAAFRVHGGEVKDFYLTMGRYDFVVISEFPDNDSAAKAALAIGSTGAVVTETMAAFDEAAYRDIIAAV